MSYQAIERLKFAPVTATQKLVLLALADCYNEKSGRCDPSIRFLSALTGLSGRSVLTAIEQLCNANIVTKHKSDGFKNCYLLTSETYAYPCSSFTSEGASPVKDVHRGCEGASQGGVKELHNITGNITGNKPEDSIFCDSPNPKKGEFVKPEKKPRKKRTPKPTNADPRFVPFRNAWVETYLNAVGSAYRFHPHDGVQLSKFLKHESKMTAEEWDEFLTWLYKTMKDKGDFAPGAVKRACGSLAAACSQFNQLLILAQA